MNRAVLDAVLVFFPAALVLTITPGTDTLLVLRSATRDGARAGLHAALGIALGCGIWAALTAFGLAAIVSASPAAYSALKWLGASYLFWLGAKALLRPRTDLAGAPPARSSGFLDGVLTNVLNPKVGVFYVSFLPQFVPEHAPVASTLLVLGAVHAVVSLLWLAALAFATEPLSRALQRPAVMRVMDRATGLVFVAFGVRLAMSAQR